MRWVAGIVLLGWAMRWVTTPPTTNAHPQSAVSRRRRRAGRRVPLEEPKEAAPDTTAAAGQPEDLERLERDFKTLLQEAKKARYLRGRNPEILERDRELTADEIFQAARPLA